ncbi:MAG: CDP-alcohol phosphatidyltransferase family protein [Actinomycetota bacterium]|nr:CDP-alcohol phosphatidyltransferase family protein [Actinomycetota bacterium]
MNENQEKNFKEQNLPAEDTTGSNRPSYVETPETERGERIDEALRWFADFAFSPIIWIFSKLRMSPNMVTLMGVAIAMLSAFLISIEKIPLAAVFFALSGILDLIDGFMAKKLGKVTPFGSFLDSFSDRLSDCVIFIGLFIYYVRLADGIFAGVALCLLVLSFLTSYSRSKAEALGVKGKAGLMARGPRLLLLGAALFFNGFSPWVLKGTMALLAALTLETLVERIFSVWRALET